MAHRSRKKHIKHMHQHEESSAAPKAKSPVAKATSAALGAANSRRVRLTTKAKEAARAVVTERAAKRDAKPAKRGVVGSIASVPKKLAAKPKRIISRAKARVRSLLGKAA